MGMDLCGIKNEDACFRVNFVAWPQLLDLCMLAGYITPKSWKYNFVLGLRTQEECDVLADMLERYLMDHDVSSMTTPQLPKIYNVTVSALAEQFGAGIVMPRSVSEYTISHDYALQFVAFLRKCGGFSID